MPVPTEKGTTRQDYPPTPAARNVRIFLILPEYDRSEQEVDSELRERSELLERVLEQMGLTGDLNQR